MRLSVIGTGYVGLVTGACFAEMGHTVTCIDSDRDRVAALRAGLVPFFEPGLMEIVAANQSGARLRFSDTLADASDSAVHFITVGTPPNADGSADLTQVLAVAREIGRTLADDCVVATKSTAPVGTTDRVRDVIAAELATRKAAFTVDVVCNPEFLKQGNAVGDFMRPERIVVGATSERAAQAMRALYGPFMRSHERLLVMGVRDAELTKYAANAMLATRISFMNELAELCERVGVDVENVRRGIGSDMRIGHAFLYAGCGYGGSCFPKDVKALIHMTEGNGVAADVMRAVESRNQRQKARLLEKIGERFEGRLAGRVVGVWGLAFKPGTDDLREAPALALIEGLIGAGAKVQAYDPVAMDTARRILPAAWIESGALALVPQQYDVARGADALALVTEWKPFRNPDFARLKELMRVPAIFDGRNQYDPREVRAAGLEYFGIGR